MKEIRSERSREAQGQRAGVVSQAIGAGLDAVVIFALDFAVLLTFGFLRFLVTDKPYEFPQPGPFLNVVILFVVGVLLLWTAWAGSGRAPGMAVLGLRVVGKDRRPLSSGRAFWRAVLGVGTLGLGVLWVLVSKKNKSIYDIVCGSAVVYEWRPGLPTSLPDSRQNQ
jgi:uncharacterized RDD family membrane protein YckC